MEYVMPSWITDKLLDVYYDLWKQGHTDKGIRQIIQENYELSNVRYKEVLPYMQSACRIRISNEVCSLYVEGKEPDRKMFILTPARSQEFMEYLLSGLKVEEAAYMMNIPLLTVTEIWMRDEMFAEMVKNHLKYANARIKKGLFHKAAGGRKIAARTVSQYLDKEGNLVETTTITERETEADPRAAEFWLINQDSENWSKEGGRSTESSKGLIAAFLEMNKEVCSPEQAEKYRSIQQQHEEDTRSTL